MIDSQGREWHVFEREDSSITIYYTRKNEPVHYVVWDSLDQRPTTRAVDLLDSSAKSALVAQPANH